MQMDKERRLFEAWAVSEGNLPRKRLAGRHEKGLAFSYVDKDVQALWVGWYARATLFVVLLQELRYG